MAFWCACHGGQPQTAEYLLERGADLNWVATWDGHTPLDTARREGADDVVAWLRTRGARTADELPGGGEGAVMAQDQSGGVPDRSQRFTATVTVDRQGRTRVPVTFDPDEVWGRKPRHHVTGSLAGCGLRGVIDEVDCDHVLVLGPAWSRGGGPADGAALEVVLTPEGPQRSDLAVDVATALDASPAAGAFFDSLAQVYRTAYLGWIDAAKRRPDRRPVRIAEMIRLLEEGKKQRPQP